MRSKISILQLALYVISITMSKTEHPANMVLLTESERFVQIFALLVDNKGQYESNRTVGKVDLWIVNTEK